MAESSSNETKLVREAVVFAAGETNINANKVLAVLQLLIDEECTVPFIARYRKEKTGEADEIQIRAIHESYEGYLEREKRRAYIIDQIEKMEKMTPELKNQIIKADTLNKLEDIYAPYKSKKKSKGQLAIDKGLLPLADALQTTTKSLKELNAEMSKNLINKENKIENFGQALLGACDILIEKFGHDLHAKEILRKDVWSSGYLVSTKRDKIEKPEVAEKFKDYFEYKEAAQDLKIAKSAHRYLAMRRGMTLKILKVELEYPAEAACSFLKKQNLQHDNYDPSVLHILDQCIEKSWNNYLYPSLDLEIKSELKKLADESAIDVFGVNLKNLLLMPYLGAKAVLGIDPGVRTGCKTVIISETGELLGDTVIYPHPPQNAKTESAMIIDAAIEKFNIKYVAIGNGTYGRETLHFLQNSSKYIKSGKVKATLVNEDGASIYSASEIAHKEFPNKDVTVRGAVSIARRFQDPLAELVKIDPKSIGVGQYQHDVNQTKLKTSLTGVVESCVNFVGVDVNTASAPLLSYISGISAGIASNIVKYREKNKGIKSRSQLLKIARLGPKVFEQCAGFLRIWQGLHPLDSTSIHPENYNSIELWAKEKGVELNDLINDKDLIKKLELDSNFKQTVGEFTHADIIKSLKSPSQDPRTEFKSTEFRDDINSIKDLKPSEWYTGVITNITNFGAFVDIGIKENGLLHVSQMADHFVENPLAELKVGQEVKVRVLEIDMDRKRISLSRKTGETNSSTFNNNSGKKSKNSKQPPVEQKLKNNAFGALKNLRI